MSGELVRVTIDERDVHVPKGTGSSRRRSRPGSRSPSSVTSRASALRSAPAACASSRSRGCRRSPRPPARMTAQDGMVVKTARTSQMAAEAQNATLEFILVNHPLDCPVCDKGGECPLQDLTFRYGPGNTRMSFEKLTFEKPIPISPTISLDRERCILCYRCTRFSSDVARGRPARRGEPRRDVGDHDLRGPARTPARSPATSPSSARSARCCPTQYRFEGRPWEIVDVPTVCGLCPVGCNVNATVREGKVKRILSRNHPEIDEGWICDKGRFAFTHLRAEDRLAEPLSACACSGARARSWDDALDEAERLLRRRAAASSRRSPAPRRSSRRTRSASCCASGSTRTRRCCRRRSPARSTRYRLPLSAIRDADAVVVLGDVPVVERAPVVDLWIKAARRNGARILDDATTAVAEAERVVLIWSAPAGRGGATVAKLAEKLGLAGREGCGAFYLPETPNGRGVADAWAACCDEEPPRRRIDRRARRLGRRGRGRSRRPRARRAGRGDDRDLDVRAGSPRAGPTSSCRARATSSATARSSTSRAACSACAARSTPPCPDELEWISQLAARFDVDVAPYAAASSARFAKVYGGLSFGEVGERAPLRVYPEAPEHVARRRPEPEPEAKRQGDPARRVQAALLRRRRRARHRAPVPAAAARARALARRRGGAASRPATSSPSARTAARSRCRPASTAACARGSRASRSSTRRPRRDRGRAKAEEVIGADATSPGGSRSSRRCHRQHPARPLRLPDAGSSGSYGPDAAPLRPEPRRPVRPAAADRRPREARPQGGVLAVGARSSCRTSSRRSSRRSPRSPPSPSSRGGPAGR